MAVSFYIYMGLSFLLALYFTKKSKTAHPVIATIICYWIFISDVGNMDGLKINVGSAFDLQPLRILFLTSISFLAINPFFKQYRRDGGNTFTVQPHYEKVLIYLTLAGIFSLFLHFNIFPPVEFFNNVTVYFLFLLIYFLVKEIADDGFVEAFKNALVTTAIISCIIAIIQLIVDQSFFRVNPDFARPAFGGILRSTGAFRDDYIHSYVVYCALVWVYFTYKNGVKKNLILGLFALGIFIAFMRMGYIVAAVFAVHATLFASTASKKLKILILTMSFILGIFAVFGVLLSGVMESDVAQERMMDEGTMELRFQLYEKALELSVADVQHFLFGYGGDQNPVYFDAVYEVTNSELWASGEKGGWHNLYIDFLYKYGFPTLLLFFIFLFMLTKYYYHLAKNGNSFYYIPFYLVVGYIISNLTLGFSFDTPFAITLAISAGLAAKQRTFEIQQIESNDLKKV